MKNYSAPLDLRAFGILVLATMADFPSSQGANLLVYNTHDSGAGTLRQAILDNKNLGGGNAIIFSNVVTGTILLTTGELLISNNVTILGPGANVLAVNGNAASRVFHITSANVSISGLTITNGLGYGDGGGILNENSTLMMSACILNGNSATNGYGGGIYNYYSTLTVSNCTISGNSTSDDGGGIYNDGDGASAALTLIASTISGNSAYAGGGVFNWASYNNDYTGNATVTLIGCTFSGNLSVGGGGGIYNYAYVGSATLTISNCTFSGNSSGGAGGGIVSYSDYNDSITTVKVIASTFSGNSAPVFADSIFIYSDLTGSGNLATLELGNSIMKAGTNIYNNAGYAVSDGYNLSSDNGGGALHATGDQINTDPKLGPLQDNGGPTLTQAPLPGSPAIDQGKSFGLATDQRGRPRPFDNPGTLNAIGGDGSDIGAVEAQTREIFPILVTNANDNGSGSLRQALSAAVPGITIAFQSNVTGTIKLTSGELLVTNNLNILGPGANVLAVSGNNAGRVFNVPNGMVNISGLTIRDGKVTGAAGQLQDMTGGGIYSGSPVLLTLAGCVISNCAAVGVNGLGTIYGNGGKAGNGFGGGIYNLGGLTLSNCWVVGNLAAGGQGGAGGHTTIPGFGGNGGNGMGGGIFSSSSQNVTIHSSTLSANLATYGAAGGGGLGSGTNGMAAGAGLDAYSGVVTLINSTIASNVVNGAGSGVGGGIYASAGGLGLLGCTIASNNSDAGGGGLAAPGGSGVTNSIIALNTGGISPDVSGTVSSGGYNLIGNTSGSNGFGATGDQLNVNPLLGPLQNNGGPTPTMALLAGSPAIDRGKSFGLTTDQRGAARPYDFASLPNASGGDGSDIGAYELVPPAPVITRVSLSGANLNLTGSNAVAGEILYTLTSTNLAQPLNQWQPVATNAVNTSGNFTIIATNAVTSGKSRQFYILQAQ